MKYYKQDINVVVELDRPMWIASVFADRFDMKLECEFRVYSRNYGPSDTAREVEMDIIDVDVTFYKDGDRVIEKNIEPYVSKDWDEIIHLYRKTQHGSLYDFLIDQLDTSGF